MFGISLCPRPKRFYTKLFGWKYKDSDIPGIEYYLIDGVTPGGAINPLAQDSKIKAPTICFGVEHIDKSVKTVRDQGGAADEKMPIQARAGSPPAPTRMATPSRSSRTIPA